MARRNRKTIKPPAIREQAGEGEHNVQPFRANVVNPVRAVRHRIMERRKEEVHFWGFFERGPEVEGGTRRLERYGGTRRSFVGPVQDKMKMVVVGGKKANCSTSPLRGMKLAVGTTTQTGILIRKMRQIYGLDIQVFEMSEV